MANYTFRPEDIEPLLEGMAILGTGGGGAPEWGRAILNQDLELGRIPKVVDLDQIPDDSTVVCGGIMGSVKVLETMGTDKVMARWEERFELLEVTRIMEDILGKKISYAVPFEIGGLNTPVILTLGARMGIDIIDGDGLGRSAPETQMTSFIGHGVQLTPMPLIDFNGNVVIVKEAADSTYPDQVGRFVVTHGGGLGANNHYPMTGAQAKTAIIPNTISKALLLGRELLDARNSGDDPVLRLTEHLGGVLLHIGEISAMREEESMGFYFTTVSLSGRANFSRIEAELIIKNETMMLTVGGEVKAYFPDLILLIEPGTGRGIMSVELKVGMPIALIGLPCHPRLREAAESQEGKIAFSPARYGQIDAVYTPIETLVPELGG
ncbi:MAG: DUF917 family protein [Anaerolineales bacterium]|nr:DUF917 family protein [Anaerolineales bacterium]